MTNAERIKELIDGMSDRFIDMLLDLNIACDLCVHKGTCQPENDCYAGVREYFAKEEEKAMKERLVVQFARIGNVLAAKVLDQPDDLRGADIIEDHETYAVASTVHPDIFDNVLLIRGTSAEYDDEVGVYKYTNEDEAKKALQAFSEIIESINRKRIKKQTEAVETVTVWGFDMNRTDDMKNHLIEAKCPECGKVFLPAVYHSYRINAALFCSYTCYMRAFRKHEAELKEKRRKPRGAKHDAT